MRKASLPCNELTRKAILPQRARMSGLETVDNQHSSPKLHWCSLMASGDNCRREAAQSSGRCWKGAQVLRKVLLGRLYGKIAVLGHIDASAHKRRLLRPHRAKAISRKISTLGEDIRHAAPKEIIKMSGERDKHSTVFAKNNRQPRVERRYLKRNPTYTDEPTQPNTYRVGK